MAKEPTKSTSSPDKQRPSGMTLIGDIVDTTWRMFVPSIGGTLLGLWADTQLGTGPWLLILGILLGSAAATVLVWRQLDVIKRIP